MKPTRSAKRTETSRRSAAARLLTEAAAAGALVGAERRPALAAELHRGAFGAPQDGQASASAVPHSPQNFRPASFAEPHAGQETVSDTAQL